MMIDWLSGVIKIDHNPIKTGQLVSFDADGQVEFVSVKSQIFEGSYSSKFLCKSQGHINENGQATEIYFSGNPSKFLQGHNVFGSNDGVGLLFQTFLRLERLFDFGFCSGSLRSSVHSSTITRIDLTNSLQFKSVQQVRAYIKQLSLLAHTRNGRPSQKGWTLKFNPNSRRWKVTVYSKGDEVQSNKLHKDFPHKDFIQKEADNLCRIELRLQSLELADLNLKKLSKLTPETTAKIYAEYIGRVQMSEKIEITPDEINNLPPSIRGTYFNWKGGFDIYATMSQPTFYRHRSKLLDIGVDISRPYSNVVTNIVPLKTVIHGQPYQIPSEAYEKNLVFMADDKPKLYAI